MYYWSGWSGNCVLEKRANARTTDRDRRKRPEKEREPVQEPVTAKNAPYKLDTTKIQIQTNTYFFGFREKGKERVYNLAEIGVHGYVYTQFQPKI